MLSNTFILFWKCIFGPELYQTYPNATKPAQTSQHNEQSTHIYVKNTAENLGDKVFNILSILVAIFRLISPLFLLYLYLKGSFKIENGIAFLELSIFIAIVPVYFLLIRGFGRFLNPDYIKFIHEFSTVKNNATQEARQKLLARYDFSLSHWKPDYRMESTAIRRIPLISTTKEDLMNRTEVTLIERLLHYPSLLFGYICVNVFGRRLMFPGSLQILRHSLNRALLDGRANLIVSYHAKRYVLRTADGNHIDTVFVDARSTENGHILVITCEGNAGFYEIGCMMTPIQAGYSVLGWNRPGFAESSGYPGVVSEANSIDTVMRYAIEELKFPIKNIVIFAWSIGGYSACWAAVHYQDIRGLVLDAIFDDVLPLAQRQMPPFASRFVEKTIRYYLDLNNVELLKLYNGPFYLIRRIYDEVMNLTPGKAASNRANEILFSILPHRYPFIYNSEQIFNIMKKYICLNKLKRTALLDEYCSDTTNVQHLCDIYRLRNPLPSYPCNFGEKFSNHERHLFAIYLINRYLVDFDSQHCTPLPQELFYLPNRCV